ncbi:MAG TPA: methylornithine synthase PylB [Bacillota bacterium]|nr:methylornithine synthase PylB [Bacillota bacterium]
MGNQGLQLDLEEILAKAVNGLKPDRREVLFILNLVERDAIEKLFQAARALRNHYFGSKVYLYGFIYFSTYCRNNCTFCYYRQSNKVSPRYRKTRKEIIEAALKLTESGIHLLDLTMGEDQYYRNVHFEELIGTIFEIKEQTGLPLMISPGVVPRDVLKEFKQIGVDWYACYQETHNRELFKRIRLNQSYDERLNLKYYAHELGMLIEEGLLAGIGESTEDLYHSFEVMDSISADQVRVMSFVPQKGTPLEKLQPIPRLREMLVIAVMRLLFPDKLIPASLDVDGISGLKQRLNAGANVVTSIIPPDRGLMGVSQSTLDIQEGGRSVDGIVPILEECGLTPASRRDYATWVEKQKTNLLKIM